MGMGAGGGDNGTKSVGDGKRSGDDWGGDGTCGDGRGQHLRGGVWMISSPMQVDTLVQCQCQHVQNVYDQLLINQGHRPFNGSSRLQGRINR